jgi:hypothetical protein
LGQFVENLVYSPKSKGLETPFKQAQPPAKTHKQPTQNQRAQSQSGLVPLIEQKIKKKMGGFLGEMGFGIYWEKTGNIGVWRPAVGGYGGEGPAVVSGGWRKWWMAVG